MNISGKFKLPLTLEDGSSVEREIVGNFAVIEQLEGGVLGRTIIECLIDGMNAKVSLHDIVKVFHTALVCNKDTRLSRTELGNAMMRTGIGKYTPLYLEFLTYLINGDQPAQKASDTGEA